MSPEQKSAIDAFVVVRIKVAGALNAAHDLGLGRPAVQAAYGMVADCLIELDELGKFSFGEANYVFAATVAAEKAGV